MRKKTRLYDVYQKRIQLIGYDHGNRNKNVFKSFELLLSDVRNTKTLSLKQRKQLWTAFETDDMQAKEKEIRLALRALAKAASVWDDRNSFLSKIRQSIDNASRFENVDEVRKSVSEIRDLCDNALKSEGDFYTVQVCKAVDSLE